MAIFGLPPPPPPLTPQLVASQLPLRSGSTLTRTRWWPPLWLLTPSPTQRTTQCPAALGWATRDSTSTTGKTPADMSDVRCQMILDVRSSFVHSRHHETYNKEPTTKPTSVPASAAGSLFYVSCSTQTLTQHRLIWLHDVLLTSLFWARILQIPPILQLQPST